MNYQKMMQVIAQSTLDIPCRELAERAAAHCSIEDIRGALWILQDLYSWASCEDLPEVSTRTMISILETAMQARSKAIAPTSPGLLSDYAKTGDND